MSNIIQNSIADRLGGRLFGQSTELYKFAKIKQAKAEALRTNPDRKIIDMGVGEPDWTADRRVSERLYRETREPANRFYADNGIPEFQQACVEYMHNVFDVRGLDIRNVIHGIGSKPVLAMLPMCFINPGDFALETIPGYPVLGTHTRYLGGIPTLFHC